MTVLDDWVTAACVELDLDPSGVPVPAVLDLARDVAHQVLRPGAPVTAYLLGLAVGRGADPRTPPPGSVPWRATGRSSWAPTPPTRPRPDLRVLADAAASWRPVAPMSDPGPG
ncbi:hypothetical protein GCM10027614_49880 [Micromonospora vulcania]